MIDSHMQDWDYLCKKAMIGDTKEGIEDDAEVEGEEDVSNYAQVNSFQSITAYYSNNFMEGYIVSTEQLQQLNESSCVQELQ